jgi:hypothetical protein
MIYTLTKTGTHLISNIIALMINENIDIYDKQKMYSLVPHIKKYNGESIFSTHPGYIKYENMYDIPIITTIRNPLDILISRYYFFELRLDTSKQRTLFNYCLDNIDELNDSLLKHLDFINSHDNILFLKFEDLVNSKKEQIIKIFNFLSKNTDIPIKINTNLILEKTSFLKVNSEEKQRGLYMVGKNQKTMFHRDGRTYQFITKFNADEQNILLNKISNPIINIYK